MYKVMLVDDEKLIIEGIFNIIDWEKLNLEVVCTANNGQDALEKFKMDPVDIVITDIKMPKMTGLELLEKIKKINSKSKFIILSGYDEFSFAKKAMEYGACSYILKPVNEQELEDVLKQLVISINKDLDKEKTILWKNRILFEYVNSKASIDELIKIKDHMNIGFNNKKYTISIITIVGEHNTEIYMMTETIINNILKDKFDILYEIHDEIVVINSWDNEIEKDEIQNYYNNIMDEIICELKVDVFITIGNIVDVINDLGISYKSANDLRKYILTEGVNVCLNSNSFVYKEESKILFNKEIEKINKLIIEKNMKNLYTYIDKIFEDKRLTPKNIYDLSLKILFLTDRILEEFKLDRKYKENNLMSIIIKLCNENTRENVKSFIISELYELVDLINHNVVKYSPVVQQVVNIANKKYYEELSLKTLSYKYNVNSSYLGQIFNKEVGVSFSEYLNKIKNTKAKELILTTNMKINDIAKAVGYTDTSYFYRKFKKYFGVCPSAIRNMKKY